MSFSVQGLEPAESEPAISIVQENASKKKGSPTTELDTVTITAQADDNELPSVTAFQQTFQRELFVNKYQNLSEFLNQQNGVQISSRGLGVPSAVSIRGSTHQQVTLMVDGYIIENSQFGGFDLDAIPLQQIESVSVSQAGQGSNSHNAIGGTIHIKTRNFDQPKNALFSSIGSFSTYKFGGSWYPILPSSIADSQSWLISAQGLRSQNDFIYPVPQPLNDPNNFDHPEAIKSNAFRKYDVLLKGKIGLSENTDLQLTANVNKSHKDIPNYQRNSTSEAKFLSHSKNLTTNFQYQLTSQQSISSRLKYSSNNDRYIDLNNTIGLSADDTKYRYQILDFQQGYQYQSQQWQLNSQYTLKHHTYRDDKRLVAPQFQCLTTQSTCSISSSKIEHNFANHVKVFSKNQYHQFSLSHNFLFEVSQQQETLRKSSKTRRKNVNASRLGLRPTSIKMIG